MAEGNPISAYLAEINKALQAGNATEHTHRPALKAFVQAIAQSQGLDVTATNEPKQVECGAPDFVVSAQNIPLGHIEAKDVGKDLDVEEKSEQLTRYLDGLPNLILTDYSEFRWYVLGEHRTTAKINLATGDGGEEAQNLITEFLKTKIKTIQSPADLAHRMGGLARLMRDAIRATFKAEDKGGKLHDQLKGFRQVLIENLSEEEFADMYAQTICYGLFAARCNHNGGEPFTRFVAGYELPKTNPFLREIFGHIAGPELDGRVTWIVDDLAELLDRTDTESILRDFGRRTRREDPVVHFYETFLAEYNPKLREMRGVYYTPEPVVSYIVASIDEILKRDFKIADGIADYTKILPNKVFSGGRKGAHKVTILDPATGTGTFLHEIIRRIHAHLQDTGQSGTWSGYVSQHLLPRIFGFELLMAPYAVCHMKLGLQLADTGYDFRANERLRVYLTNSLEEAHEDTDLPLFTQHLAREAKEAGEAKQDHPVMVVLGNPPYSGHSANKGKWIHNLMRGKDLTTGEKAENYFEVDGGPLGERNPKWLNDDYVKFIRFAQWRIEQTGYGILAFITNHGYLDNPTFRGMRQSLMNTFDDIYVLDLHGNAKKKEKAPDGTADQNVFDIQQGVAIGIFVRKLGNRKAKPATVRHAELWGTRETWGGPKDDQHLMGGKYHWLWGNDVTTTRWKKLQPESPYYLFQPMDKSNFAEYMDGYLISEIYPVNSLGIATARDKLVIQHSQVELLETANDVASLPVEEARRKYNIGEDSKSGDWKLAWAQIDLKNHPNIKDFAKRVGYRPFDTRHTIYTGTTKGFMCRPRTNVMSHMISGNNLALSTTRSIEIERGWEHVFCFSDLIQLHSVSLKEVNYLFPLYLYPKEEKEDLFDVGREATDAPGGRRPNLSEEFIDEFKGRLGLDWLPDGVGDLKRTFGPEDVFHYMYAVFHARAYRERYAEYLAIDFPRLPLTSNVKLFRVLCTMGRELTGLHLMEEQADRVTSYPIDGDNGVEKVTYRGPEGDQPGRVWINKTQYFQGVPPGVWEFHVGGYRVCDKWLKDRKNRKLTHADIQHYQNIVAALARTIELMGDIDNAIDKHGGWPIK